MKEITSNGYFYWSNFGDFRRTQNGDFCPPLTRWLDTPGSTGPNFVLDTHPALLIHLPFPHRLTKLTRITHREFFECKRQT